MNSSNTRRREPCSQWHSILSVPHSTLDAPSAGDIYDPHDYKPSSVERCQGFFFLDENKIQQQKTQTEHCFVKTERHSCEDGSESNGPAEQRRDQEAERAALWFDALLWLAVFPQPNWLFPSPASKRCGLLLVEVGQSDRRWIFRWVSSPPPPPQSDAHDYHFSTNTGSLTFLGPNVGVLYRD